MATNDFLNDFILSYFKAHRNGYSISEIALLTGRPISQVGDAINGLLRDGRLIYDQSHMLRLSQKGRLDILDQRADNRDLSAGGRFHLNKIDPEAALPIDRVYVPKRFLSKT